MFWRRKINIYTLYFAAFFNEMILKLDWAFYLHLLLH